MVNTSLKRRRTEEQLRGKVPKKEKRKVKKQKHYHSSSDEEEGAARDAPARGSSLEPDEPFQPSGANATLPGKSEPSKQQLRKQARFEAKKAAQQAAAAEESSASDDENDEAVISKKPEPKFKASIPAKTPTKPALKKTAPVDHEAPLPSDDDDDNEDNSEPEADEFSIADSESDVSDGSTGAARKVRKRNDPEAFANSISKILGSKLTTSKRSEPILSRSKDAATANRELADSKLTEKARRQVVAERKALQNKGRVKDVLGLNDPDVSTAVTSTKEKELKRTAQKGVIKLFNAVRAAQVKGEQAERESKAGMVVGMDKREEKVKEMSKQGFLDMITGGQNKEGSVEA
ncbi:ribosomal rna-processing 15 [Pyrenophora seminiperda CCB06]|uniref:Ribosomal rna-processing 15 n=1 Tax=Pyrenophora seminiperda CCB06 TaxID=1302712 RepID=A0A3M7M0Q1_9PLEO|nr:ribosomal rna-processing 15 [Pyrenophora seminiperda CCB06]